MSREIKFRMWSEGYMDHFTFDNDFDCICGWLEDAVLMQYIGLKDKEEKEIYDRDIIESDISNEIGVIVYDPEKCYYNVVDLDDYKNGTRYNCAMINTAGYNWMQYDIKVIGNIHQNKELLNQG